MAQAGLPSIAPNQVARHLAASGTEFLQKSTIASQSEAIKGTQPRNMVHRPLKLAFTMAWLVD